VLVDWFTVAAQLLNFTILVWLMKRFLYQPVLDAIAAREQKIAQELADAADTEAQAHRQRDAFQKKNQALDEQRDQLLKEARQAADEERQRLQREARQAADAASATRAQAQLRDAEQLRSEITQRAQQQVFDISRRVLADLADVGLEQRMCEVFIQKLQALQGAALSTMGTALGAATEADPVSLRSAFDLPEAQRAALQAAVDAVVGQPVALRFETRPELVSGLALSAGGQKLAWTIADYLGALSTDLEAQLRVAEPA
jgi:F-type H+-transporting ATPase subunit b